MKSQRNPYTAFISALAGAPVLFALGLVLFDADRTLGDPFRIEGGGAAGIAANLSMVGLTAILQFLFNYGPQLMILIGLALPISIAVYTVQKIDVGRGSYLTKSRRSLLWSLACVETFAMLGVFVMLVEAV